MSVEQPQQDAVPGVSPELRAVEAGLKGLWERARRASEAVRDLREEKRILQGRVEELEREVGRLTQDLRRKEEALHLVESAAGADTKRGTFLGDGEREALAQRIKTLLVKLDAYL
jgi:chromosome segregation ATPase